MNIEDLKLAVEQAAQVHKFLYEHRIEFADMLGSDAYQVWYRLDLKLIEIEKARAAEKMKAVDLSRMENNYAAARAETTHQKAVMEEAGKPDELSRITAQIVAESAHQKAVMAAAMSGIDRIMAEYHDDIEEATK